jgi:hypothetical protein
MIFSLFDLQAMWLNLEWEININLLVPNDRQIHGKPYKIHIHVWKKQWEYHIST